MPQCGLVFVCSGINRDQSWRCSRGARPHAEPEKMQRAASGQRQHARQDSDANANATQRSSPFLVFCPLACDVFLHVAIHQLLTSGSALHLTVSASALCQLAHLRASPDPASRSRRARGCRPCGVPWAIPRLATGTDGTSRQLRPQHTLRRASASITTTSRCDRSSALPATRVSAGFHRGPASHRMGRRGPYHGCDNPDCRSHAQHAAA